MKYYNVEVYRAFTHGQHGSNYRGIATFSVTAKSKKEAKEIVLNNFIGEPITKYPDFPIDPEHAPEYVKNGNCWTAKLSDVEKHIINEYDIAIKRHIVVDVTEIK